MDVTYDASCHTSDTIPMSERRRFLRTRNSSNMEFVEASKPTRINLARYINHSCDPNAVVELWQTPEGKSRALVISKKDIYPNEEITINYGRHELFRWVTVFPLTLAAVIVYHHHVLAGNVEVHRGKDDAVVTVTLVSAARC
ncbi:hypothetical protein B0H14DRAFT_3128535 [Mycena olivaceomarginata]|nr:hypothetical protein B0H14DRAFT_3128535 [Mycena olivaceomarginata]